jgi:hypothetical protein
MGSGERLPWWVAGVGGRLRLVGTSSPTLTLDGLNVIELDLPAPI